MACSCVSFLERVTAPAKQVGVGGPTAPGSTRWWRFTAIRDAVAALPPPVPA
jgi:hypothetical protein